MRWSVAPSLSIGSKRNCEKTGHKSAAKKTSPNTSRGAVELIKIRSLREALFPFVCSLFSWLLAPLLTPAISFPSPTCPAYSKTARINYDYIKCLKLRRGKHFIHRRSAAPYKCPRETLQSCYAFTVDYVCIINKLALGIT